MLYSGITRQKVSLQTCHGRDGVKVAIKSYAPMKVGDKMAGRYGDKGVVGEIIPDDKMPKDEQGRPSEVILNPTWRYLTY
jgi:DNA-directed RNA polymerase beta subunit